MLLKIESKQLEDEMLNWINGARYCVNETVF